MLGKGTIIVGGGQAAVQAAHLLRTKGYDEAISIITDEAYAPYQRPPLSKAYLKGDLVEKRLFLKPESFYQNKSVDLITSTCVTRLNPEKKTIQTDSGIEYCYNKLIIATGARPRKIEEISSAVNALEMRTLNDAKRLQGALENIQHVTIVGGGYIGLEAASVVKNMGKGVVVIEREDRLLARVTSPIVAGFFKRLHENAGVKILLNAAIDSFSKDPDGNVSKIQMEDGQQVETDLVLVGVGVHPNQELAADAGIVCSNGIHVDANAQTSDPDIYAIGDCSLRPIKGQKEKLRLESVLNALDQAAIATSHLIGDRCPDYEPPWFWSDQYQTKIQTAGLFRSYTATIIRGDPDDGCFSVFYFEGSAFIAVDAVNDPQSFMASKQILKSGLKLTIEHLSDENLSIMEIVKSLKEEVKEKNQ